MDAGSLFSNVPTALLDEFTEILVSGQDVTVERIVSHGHRSPDGFWYDQDRSEWVMVVSGNAKIEFADGAIRDMNPGDWVTISPHEKHRVSWTNPECDTVWLAV
ncbi:MAG TPA: cupin domain-containing protein, partial [Firmicutes bacterium]|nr:cupin domain-containing protein [Bacillota bacterium]